MSYVLFVTFVFLFVIFVIVGTGVRVATGLTNFSAVCVSENRATFTSTSPAALPAAMVAASDASASPLRRIAQIAPSGAREGSSASKRVRSFADSIAR